MHLFLAQAAGGFLDQMVADMLAKAQQYEARSGQIGLGLFGMLQVVGFATYFWRYHNAHKSLHGIEAGFFEGLKAIAIPFVIMLAVLGFLPLIDDTAITLSGDISGVVITGPSELLLMGARLGAKVIAQPMSMIVSSIPPGAGNGGLAATLGLNVVPNAAYLAQHSGSLAVGVVGTVIAALIAAFIIMPSFAFIALELLCSIGLIAIVLSSGAFMMGWSAAPGTSNMAERYYASVQAAVMRLIVIYITAAFIGATVGLWSSITSSTDLGVMVFSLLKVAGGSIVCAGLAMRLPGMAAEVAGGSPSFGGSAVAGAARNAAGAVNGAVRAIGKVAAAK